MDEELQRLTERAARFARTGEQLTEVFARELAAVWRDADRALARLIRQLRSGNVGATVSAARAMALKAQIREILSAAGYDALVTAAARTGTDEMVRQALVGRQAAQAALLVTEARPVLDALRAIAATDLLGQGDEVAHSLWRSLSQWLFTSRPTEDIIQDLADALDLLESDVRALFDTQVSIYGRQVEALATDALGPEQPFLYTGPIDDATRDWCLERVGKVFSRAAIDQLDNGQLPNPFLTAGGYNCRHSWMAVESEQLRALTDTGERVSATAREVERLKAFKAAKRAAKRKKAA